MSQRRADFAGLCEDSTVSAGVWRFQHISTGYRYTLIPARKEEDSADWSPEGDGDQYKDYVLFHSLDFHGEDTVVPDANRTHFQQGDIARAWKGLQGQQPGKAYAIGPNTYVMLMGFDRCARVSCRQCVW